MIVRNFFEEEIRLQRLGDDLDLILDLIERATTLPATRRNPGAVADGLEGRGAQGTLSERSVTSRLPARRQRQVPESVNAVTTADRSNPARFLSGYPGSHRRPPAGKLGLVMGGGGARAAYQVGFLKCLARRHPELDLPILTGVSAGAINTALLASHHGTFKQAVDELVELWADLTVGSSISSGPSLAGSERPAVGAPPRLRAGEIPTGTELRSLVDTGPLHDLLTEALHAIDGELTGIQPNLDSGRLKAVALTTSSYSTGLTTTWVQGDDIRLWSRPKRSARATTLTVDHVMGLRGSPPFLSRHPDRQPVLR